MSTNKASTSKKRKYRVVKDNWEKKLNKSLSVKEINQLLISKPEEKCLQTDKKEKGITYLYSTKKNTKHKVILQRFLRDVPFINFNLVNNKFQISIIPGDISIDVQTNGILKKNHVLLNTMLGDSVFIDNKNKNYLYFDSKQLTKLGIGTNEKDIQKINISSELFPYLGYKVQKLTVIINKPYLVRYDYWISSDKKLKPFIKDSLRFLFGPKESHGGFSKVIQKISEIGFILKTEIFLSDLQGKILNEPSIVSEITDIKIGLIDTKLFRVPEDYVDLRSKKDKHKIKLKSKNQNPISRPRSFLNNQPNKITNKSNGNIQRPLYKFPNFGFSDLINEFDIYNDIPKTGFNQENLSKCLLDYNYDLTTSIHFDIILLDKLKEILNQLSRRIEHFEGNYGKLRIKWLEQFKKYSDSIDQPGLGGDGLYCLLRDDPIYDESTGEWTDYGGNGILDIIAVNLVEEALAKDEINFRISNPSLREQVEEIISNVSLDPSERWDQLNEFQQFQLREDYLWKVIGKLTIEYPNEFGPEKILQDLLTVSLSDINLDFVIGNIEIVEDLKFMNKKIVIKLRLPFLKGDAELTTRATARYQSLKAISQFAIGSIIAGITTVISIESVTAWLAFNIDRVEYSISNCEIDATIEFPKGSDLRYKPNPIVRINGDTLMVHFDSIIQDEVMAIADVVMTVVENFTHLLLDEIEENIEKKLSEFIEPILSYPPKFEPINPPILYSKKINDPETQLRFQAGLGLKCAFGNSFITQNLDYKQDIMDDLDQRVNSYSFSGTDYYIFGGFTLSQNFLNVWMNSIWQEGFYSYNIPFSEFTQVMVPIWERLDSIQLIPYQMSIFSASCPRFILAPKKMINGEGFAVTIFDDLRLCIKTGKSDGVENQMEFKFSAEVNTALGFGLFNHSSESINRDFKAKRFLDFYFNCDSINVKLISADLQDYIGKGTIADTIRLEMLSDFEDAFTQAIRLMLRKRRRNLIPNNIFIDNFLAMKYNVYGELVLFAFLPYGGNLYCKFGLEKYLINLILNAENCSWGISNRIDEIGDFFD